MQRLNGEKYHQYTGVQLIERVATSTETSRSNVGYYGVHLAERHDDAVAAPASGSGTIQRRTSINDFGVVAGQTYILPGGQRIATLWFGRQVVDLHQLIRADDPLQPYVHLESVEEINNRGDLVATGFDSRQPTVSVTFFLTLFDLAPPGGCSTAEPEIEYLRRTRSTVRYVIQE